MEFIPVTFSGSAPPKRSFHSSSTVGNKLYIFGGVSDSKTVLNDVHCFDVSSNSWCQIMPCSDQGTSRRSSPGVSSCSTPALSHHSAIVLDDRRVVIIGGWNGKKRTANVFLFDTSKHKWEELPVSGDIPVGLSSHTATLVSQNEVLIIGREGGVHMQRRFSGAFNLNVRTGRYTEAPFHASSRSGHSANLIRIRGNKEFTLFINGGRSSGGYEVLGRWKNKAHSSECTSSLLNRVSSLLERCTSCGEPTGRQYARVLELGKYLFMYGGETWSGVRNNVTNDIFILDTSGMRWFKVPLGSNVPCLTGHSLSVVGDEVYVYGGLLDNHCTDGFWKLQF